MKQDELLGVIFAKPMRAVERKDVPDWYLQINDMIANSPLTRKLQAVAKCHANKEGNGKR